MLVHGHIWHSGERLVDGSGSFNSRQNFQDINDKTAEKNKSKPNSFIKAAVGFNISWAVEGKLRESQLEYTYIYEIIMCFIYREKIFFLHNRLNIFYKAFFFIFGIGKKKKINPDLLPIYMIILISMTVKNCNDWFAFARNKD